MLKVLIADDDARTCNRLRMLIDWDTLRLKLVGAALNGADALGMVEKHHPDILITDIHMPALDGFALIERAKAAAPQLETIIVSADAQFEYAQRAIRLGVCDYLVKPVNRQQLVQALKRIAERCGGRKLICDEMEELRRSSRADSQRFLSHLMQDLLSGAMAKCDAQTLWEDYRFRLESEYLQVGLIQIDYDEERVSRTLLAVAGEKATQTISQELSGICRTLAIYINEGKGAVLLGFDEAQKANVVEALQKCLDQLRSMSNLLGNSAFSLAIAPPVTDVLHLAESSALAHRILQERLVRGSESVLQGLPERGNWQFDTMMKPYRKAVSELLESNSTQTLKEAIDALEEELERQAANGAEVFEAAQAMAHLFLQQPQVIDGKNKFEKLLAKMAHTGRGDQIFKLVRGTILCEAETLIEQQRSACPRPIRMAKEYVQKHYREQITLQKVCDEIGFSVSYFSTMFKKITGENFLRFLTRTRVERAKELLVQTSMPVSEICVQVGYSDLKYFTQTFRKETELSPGQYRKIYG